jgi:hypothetical protein
VVGGLKLVGVRFTILLGKASAVDKGSIGGFDIANEDFGAPALSPNFSVLSREYFAIEETVGGRGDRLLIGLSADSKAIWGKRNCDGFSIKSSVER